MPGVEANTLKRDLNACIQKLPELQRQEYNLDVEVNFLMETFGQIGESLFREHKYLGVAGVGGSGTVLTFEFTPHRIVRAGKLPRRKILDEPDSKDAFIGIGVEVHGLSKASHRNISRFYQFLKSDDKHYCLLTQFIDPHESLDDWIRRIADEVAKKSNLALEDRVARVMTTLAKGLTQICDAMIHLHEEAQLLHMDIKPSNILIAPAGSSKFSGGMPDVPYLIDMGLARDKEGYEPDEKVPVGFTWIYAHPALSDIQGGAKVSKTPNLAKKFCLGRELTDQLDIFAFGRTLQELLMIVASRFGDGVYSHYGFNYLHQVACLCLDGSNKSDKPLGNFVSDRVQQLCESAYKLYAFRSFRSVKQAIERFLGSYRLETEITELDPWYPQVVNASDHAPVPLTPRVRSLIDHPSFKRLQRHRQLGMIESVYPTATHSRYVHALGTFRTTCDYISALYYDPDNPTFKILMQTRSISALLAASLLHDLGQTSLGHDIEELDSRLFSHTEFTRMALEDEKVKDTDGRTIADILKEVDSGWALSLDNVEGILKREKAPPLNYVLYDILDSPLDADKMDYLRRDSVDARVPYGLAIDYRRILRTLTTAPGQRADVGNVIKLAVKHKGLAGAEAFTIARYQAFQAIYLHHTYRTLKGMLLAAFASALGRMSEAYPEFKDLDKNEVSRLEVKRLFYLTAVLSEAHFSLHTPKGQTPIALLESIQGKKVHSEDDKKWKLRASVLAFPERGELASIGADPVTQFFYFFAPPEGQFLIREVLNRRLYKRLYEQPLQSIPIERNTALLEFFRGSGRFLHAQKVSTELKGVLRGALQQASSTRKSVEFDPTWKQVEEIYQLGTPVVFDMPTRSISDVGGQPEIVPDLQRKYFPSAKADSEKPLSSLWAVTPQLMRDASTFRVVCHPDLHDIIRKVMTGEEIARTIAGYFKGVLS
jgi:HD superfamily phosphohydrolase